MDDKREKTQTFLIYTPRVSILDIREESRTGKCGVISMKRGKKVKIEGSRYELQECC